MPSLGQHILLIDIVGTLLINGMGSTREGGDGVEQSLWGDLVVGPHGRLWRRIPPHPS